MKHSRQFLILLLAACLALCPHCAFADVPQDPFLLEVSMKLSRTMGELATSESYIAMNGSMPLENVDLQDIAIMMDAVPEKAYVVQLHAETVSSVLRIMYKTTGSSQAVFGQVKHRIVPAMFSQLASMHGIEHLVVSSILSTGESFVMMGLDEDYSGALVVMTYAETLFASVVYFGSSGKDIVYGSALPLQLNDALLGVLTGKGTTSIMEEMLGGNPDVASMLPLFIEDVTVYEQDALLSLLDEA